MLPRSMLSASARTLAILIAAASTLAAGCRDQEPEAPFNRNLGDAESRLLPLPPTVHAAHDASIIEGQTQATIVKRGEAPPEIAPAAPTATGAQAGIQPANSMGEALSNIGRAFSNLMGGSEQADANASPGGEAAAAAPSGDPVDSAAAEEITRLLAEYNEKRKAKDFGSVARFLVSDQKELAGKFYNLKEELTYNFQALLDALDRSAPGTKAQVENQLSALFQPVSAEDLVTPEPDVITGQWTHRAVDGSMTTTTVTFRKQDGTWRLVDPFVPEPPDWPDVQAALTGTTESLDDLTVSILGGEQPDQARLNETLQSAMALMMAG